MLKTMRKHGLTLALFAAGSTGLTAAIDQMTKTTIAGQAAIQQKRCSIRLSRAIAIITRCNRAVIWLATRRWVKVSIICGSPKR